MLDEHRRNDHTEQYTTSLSSLEETSPEVGSRSSHSARTSADISPSFKEWTPATSVGDSTPVIAVVTSAAKPAISPTTSRTQASVSPTVPQRRASTARSVAMQFSGTLNAATTTAIVDPDLHGSSRVHQGSHRPLPHTQPTPSPTPPTTPPPAPVNAAVDFPTFNVAPAAVAEAPSPARSHDSLFDGDEA